MESDSEGLTSYMGALFISGSSSGRSIRQGRPFESSEHASSKNMLPLFMAADVLDEINTSAETQRCHCSLFGINGDNAQQDQISSGHCRIMWEIVEISPRTDLFTDLG